MASSIAEKFTLRKAIRVSDKDVRAVSRYTDDGFFTGSRDCTGKLYIDTVPNGFIEAQLFSGATHFVSCLTTLQVGEEMFIYLGSNDACIYCFDLIDPSPKCILIGHSGTVCALNSDKEAGCIISGSWDNSAIIWRKNIIDSTLKGHDQAVWTVAVKDDIFLTGSADKTIKRWSASGKRLATYEGHTDCVRCLVFIDKNCFLSSSNDQTIRRWSIDGMTLAVYEGHENYVYSISILRLSSAPEELEFVTSSEDCSVKIWKGSEPKFVQSIRVPAITAWSVACLNQDNFVAGCSDGRCFIFTRDTSKKAPREEIQAFKAEVKKYLDDQAIKQATGVIGTPSGKVLYEGKEYDYVFDVDVEDGVPPIKMPYNLDEDPYVTARGFIQKYNLSENYLEQIVDFIIKKTNGKAGKGSKGIESTASPSEYCDPFTGSSRYIPKP